MGGYRMERRRIDAYLTSDFWMGLGTWLQCKRWGLPYGGGWATAPARLLRLLQVFDGAEAKWQDEQSGNS